MSLKPSGVDQLLSPRHGRGVCPRCLNLTGADGLCRACHANEHHLAAVVPISYSVGGEWLHHLIASYKRDADPSVPDALSTLAGLSEAFISSHEACLAAAAGVPSFQLVATVPSSDRRRDLHHPLHRIVGQVLAPTRGRYERLLVRSSASVISRVFDADRYVATRELSGESVLLVDDMWTSGASAESAAARLHAAGAGVVAMIVIARHLNRGWQENDLRLRRLAREGFDPERCAICAIGADQRQSPPPPVRATAG